MLSTHQYRLFSSASDLRTTRFCSRAWGRAGGEKMGRRLSEAHMPHCLAARGPMTPQPSPGPASRVCAPQPSRHPPSPTFLGSRPRLQHWAFWYSLQTSSSNSNAASIRLCRHDRNRSVQVAADRPSCSQAPSRFPSVHQYGAPSVAVGGLCVGVRRFACILRLERYSTHS